jgi:hypothetical protein
MLADRLPVYQNHEVASLAWAIGSAPLMATSGFGLNFYDESECDLLFESHRLWLQKLDEQPMLLFEWLEKEGQKLLGHRFESLLAFFFSHSPAFELLHRNVVLIQDKNTRGEFDFIVKDLSKNCVLHIEVACKYYVGLKNSNGSKHWIGPNGHDSLYLKLEKLNQQIKVFSTEPGKNFLQENQLAINISKVFLKGYFFHHVREFPFVQMPKGANTHCNSGWFVFEEELSQFGDEVAQWLLLPKQYWMCPFRFRLQKFNLMSGLEMKETVMRELRRTQKAQMIIQVMEKDGILHELSRGFVILKNRLFKS